MSTSSTKFYSAKTLVMTSMMIAITIVLMVTPIGTIKLPLVSITIAHVPAIITALLLGLGEGLAVAFVLGVSSLLMALTSPTSVLDPFFINPLVSVLPRVLIPITTYYSYKAIQKHLQTYRSGQYLATAVSVVIGNLTNTFGVYTMLYLIYAKQILEKTGKQALSLIIAALSTTTVIKCVAIVIVVVPIVFAINMVNKQTIR